MIRFLLSACLAGVAFASFSPLTVCASLAPSITTQPQSQSIEIGSNAAFTVVASGQTPFTYQWSFNGADLVNGSHIGGATSATLTVSNITLSDDGQYKVVVKNSHGTATSSNATLTVLVPIHYVNINNPTPSPPYASWSAAATNIQDAVAVSDSGDQIIVTNGIYSFGNGVISGVTNCVTATNAISISSVTGPAQTIINGGSALRCVYLADGCVLSGFTITNGTSSNYGGGIYCVDQNVLITNCVIAGNTCAAYGGGIYEGTLIGCQLLGNQNSAADNSVMTNCVIFGNTASIGAGTIGGSLFNCMLISNTAVAEGGGSYYSTLTACTLIANTGSSYGGGAGNCTLYGCTVIGNIAGPNGGGGLYQCTAYSCMISNNIINNGGGGGAADSTLSNCVLTANSGGAAGGGANYCTLYSCTVSNNTSYEGGGADNSTLYNCLLAGNSVLYGGGGAANSTLTNCSLTENSGGYEAGGALNSVLLNSLIESNSASTMGGVGGGCVLTNCLVLGNRATNPVQGLGGGAQGSSLYNCLLTGNSSPTVGGGASASTLINCTVAGNSAGQDGGGVDTCDLTNTIVYFNSSPTNGNYSGTNYMSWSCTTPPPKAGSSDLVIGVSNISQDPLLVNTNNDFRIEPGSPCINAGNNSVVPVAVDLIGNPRIVNGIVDMGAYEVPNTPFIESQPASATVPLDEPSVSFTVLAAGPGPLTYQWLFNGTAIAGATNPTFTLSYVQYNEAGMYSVVVSNSYGITPGSNAVLTVVPPTPPQFTEQPSNQIVVVGTNVIETALATGAPAPAYQWYFNGIALSDGSHYTGATGSQLEILDAQTNDSGTYFVVATNSGGTATSLSATLTVMVVPAITLNPTSQQILLGSSATFTAAASGSAPLTYQWTFNGTTLTDGGQFSGTATTNLTISNLQLANNGNYVLIASNAVGTAASSPATLTVATLPSVSQQPTNQNILAGQNAVFSAAATGTAPLSYQWYFAGSPLVNGGGVTGATTQTLDVNNVQTNEAGSYQLVVANSYGTATSAMALLTVLLPPSITSQPTNQTVMLSSNATFTGSAAGTAPLGYQWFFNGSALTEGGGTAGSATATLNLSNIQTNQAGPYELVVTNNYGSATSAVATLTVLAPPVIIGQSPSQGVFISNNIALSASAGGTTPLTYQWSFNGDPLSDGGAISGSATATLSIQDIQLANLGDYQVAVANAYGSVTSSIIVLSLATVHYVNLNNPSPVAPYTNWSTAATTIQQAIDASFNGDEILVTNGTYSSGGRAVYGAATNRVTVDLPVTVQSVNGPQFTFIQGASPSSEGVRCAYVTNGATLSGFTLQHGYARNSGDFYHEQSGGGVWCESTSATVSNCVIIQNYSIDDGGGAVSGTLSDCVISNNTALEGAGTYSANLINCILTRNSATWGGGAFYGSISNCTVTGNSAADPGGSQEGEGGGAYGCSIVDSIFTGNSSRVDGGGAAWGSMMDCLFANNSSAEGGGMSAATIVNCTVVGNTAYTDGSVLGLGGGIVNGTAEDSIIIDNSDSFGGAQDYDESTLSDCCSSSNPNGPGGPGDIIADPLFVNYGAGDFRLQSGSPCIDTGSNGFVTVSTDLDGNPRIVNGVVDMGAYEYQHNPWFLASPTNVTVVTGTNLVLTVTVLGDPATYQWYYDGAPLSDGGRILGSSSNALTISMTVTNDSGNYWITASNNYGMATSAVIAVTVELPVTITSEPTNQTVLVGSTATFTVAASGYAPPNYLWFSNGVALANGGSISGATSATLTISSAQTNDDGAYDVIVTNVYGAATSSVATLTVVAPVQITGQPMSQDALLGGNATFTVVAAGTAPFTYQWYFDGAPLTDGGGISGSATATLGIANVQNNDAGGYYVVVSNILTSARSLMASLTPESVIAPSVRYVMLSNTNPAPPYLNWSTAATNIQDAVDASVAGDLVLVSNGTYSVGGRVFYGTTTNRLVVNKSVTVQSLNGPAGTTIAGILSLGVAHPIRCAYLTNNAVLSGFTLQSGGTLTSGNMMTNESGGGVWCDSPSTVVSNCVFIQNGAQYYAGGAYGGTLINCLLTNNTAGSGGGAASNLLLNCTLTKNIAGNVAGNGNGAAGGGAFGSTLSNCLLIANSAGAGAGASGSILFDCVLMTNTASEFGGGGYSNVMYNCLLENNSSRDGGATYNSLLYNCTVVSNTAPDGAGIFGGAATNCIIYYNYYGGVMGNDFNSKSVAYTCMVPLIGIDCITNPPLFVNLPGENFHLQSNSPCINSGKNAAVTTATDLDGNPRIVGGTVDMGAYEYQTPSSVISYAYLQQYGLPTDGSADFTSVDGTAFNVYQDWIAGLNPTNPASVLAMLPLLNTTNTSGITVRWQSVSGINYNLQRATNLLAQPPFSTIQSNIPGQSGTTIYGDTTATNKVQYFYRVNVQKP